MTGTPVPRLRVRTRAFDPGDDLLEYTDPAAPLVWLRRGEGFVGCGELTRIEVDAGGDESRTATAARAWRDLCAHAEVDDAVRTPGSGLIAFGALVFDERSAATSSLIIPRLVVGRRDGHGWLTEITMDGGDPDATAGRRISFGPQWSATLGPGAMGPDEYVQAVRSGLDAITGGEVGKVVLARDLVGTVPAGSDLRRLAGELGRGYPDTWTFAVDGLIGASPETLVTVADGAVTARVLAGTRPRGADATEDAATRRALLDSAKDRDEHAYAVHSVLSALETHTESLRTGDPFPLELPNVWHLATDVAGRLTEGVGSLDAVAALHPTAAVAGTPTARAVEVIRRLEPFDRRRYAGPVGWLGADGDGEWAIALRCAQFDAEAVGQVIPVVAHAGAGIVAGSEPESELLETRVKFRPIVDALA